MRQGRQVMGAEEHSHVIPVPRGMTAQEAWAEITTMGRLLEPDEHCTWASVGCTGECADVDRSNSRRWHNDVLIEEWKDGRRIR